MDTSGLMCSLATSFSIHPLVAEAKTFTEGCEGVLFLPVGLLGFIIEQKFQTTTPKKKCTTEIQWDSWPRNDI